MDTKAYINYADNYLVKPKKAQKATENISFRLTPEFMAILADYAANQISETGRRLTLGQAARKLVFNELHVLSEMKKRAVAPNTPT